MPTLNENYRQILEAELAQRCEKNARYSLRAFARDLEISPARLSEVLRGRYGISRAAAEKIADRLGWNKSERDHFCDLVDSEHARGKLNRFAAKERLAAQPSPYQQISLDSFQVIADWYHYALLELTTVKGFRSEASWIARKLGVSEALVASAIARLLRLDLLEENNGELRATSGFTASPSDIPSEALKKFHRQLLEKAITAIQVQSVDERDFSHLVLAVGREQIPQAKEEIKKFRRAFDQKFSASTPKDEVYCLGIGFFRIQEKS